MGLGLSVSIFRLAGQRFSCMVIFSTNNPRKRYPLQSSTPSIEEESKVFHSFSGI